MIYKILRESEYREFVKSRDWPGSADDIRDGFIHFSPADELAGTLEKHFAGEAGLWLIGVDEAGLCELKWEKSRGGKAFPHLYSTLGPSKIARIWRLEGAKLPKLE